jgi:hypothetical protein
MNGCALGAFPNGILNLANIQSRIGKKLAVVLIYSHWLDEFPLDEVKAIAKNGSVVLITWEPWVTHPLGTLNAISTGVFADYVTKFIQAAKDFNQPILLRFAHEMNGNWYPWDGAHNKGSSYLEAWRYIYNVREEIGATNVKLVWSPNNFDIPNEEWNKIAAYYPGDEYVDWLGIDGYNWGYDKWQSFDEVFGQAYQELVKLSTKPIMIGEFASAEQGGSKSDWLLDAFTKLEQKYPQIKLCCWFDINKERDWRLDSSAAALKAFQRGVAGSYFQECLL